MEGTNCVGNPEVHPCAAVNYTDAHGCQAECDADAKCAAWTHHFTAANTPSHGDKATWRCCRKTSYKRFVHVDNMNTTSGVKIVH